MSSLLLLLKVDLYNIVKVTGSWVGVKVVEFVVPSLRAVVA